MDTKEMEKSVLQVPVEDIIPNRFQPRLAFDDDSLKDLASSIKQHGIIQPLVLRRKNDKYEIIAGERRFKAAKLAGLTSVPAVITTMDDNESAEVAIVENVQRKDLTAIEEAKSYQALLDKGYMTQEELAKKMGLSQSAISNKLRLLTLDDSVQEAILKEQISERHARTLLKVPNRETQKELLTKVIKERLTVKQLEDEIKELVIETKESEQTEDVPVITNTPDIASIVENAIDLELKKEEEKEEVEVMNVEPIPEVINKNNNLFTSPDQMPNKFFNFLEDTAANMNFGDTYEIPELVEEPVVETEEVEEALVEDVPVENVLVDEIEMLDFLEPIEEKVEEPSVEEHKDTYILDVVKNVRNLGLDPARVEIEELDLNDEYKINITIKKEN